MQDISEDAVVDNVDLIMAEAKFDVKVTGDLVVVIARIATGLVLIHSSQAIGSMHADWPGAAISQCRNGIRAELMRLERYSVVKAGLEGRDTSPENGTTAADKEAPEKAGIGPMIDRVFRDSIIRAQEETRRQVDASRSLCFDPNDKVGNFLEEIRLGLGNNLEGSIRIFTGKKPESPNDTPEETGDPLKSCLDCYFSHEVRPWEGAWCLICRRHPPECGEIESVRITSVCPNGCCSEYERDPED